MTNRLRILLMPLLFMSLVAGGLTLMATATPASAAATYSFSSSTGSDSNYPSPGCTQASPCASLSLAASLLVNPGDTVLLKRGDTWAHQGMRITTSGGATPGPA